MVASSQTLASEAGLRILRSGGNAFDAAVAVAAALNVCEPTSTGIGGDAFALCYHADSKAVTSVVGGGASPAALTLELCRERGHAGSEISPSTDALCVMVPGACAVWEDVVTKHGSGKLTLGDVFAPAIELAEGGAPIGPVTAELWRRQEDLLKQQGASCMLVDGARAPRAGERKSNPELAATFRRVAEHGAHAGFYTGPIAEAIVNAVAERGGVLTLEDLAGHKTKFPEPLSTTYRDTVRVWELPPPNHGLAALLALNCLEAVLPGVGAPAHCRTWDHSAVESMKIAFADTLEHCGDPDHPDALLASLTPAQLIDKEYAKARVEACGVNAQGLKCTSVTGVKGDDGEGEGGDSNVAGLRPSPDTVYFCVVDGDGNACSFINSNYDGFGTGIAPEGCGFTLQNRGHNFILREGHVNCVGPSKRPYHTIIPGHVNEDGLRRPLRRVRRHGRVHAAAGSPSGRVAHGRRWARSPGGARHAEVVPVGRGFRGWVGIGGRFGPRRGGRPPVDQRLAQTWPPGGPHARVGTHGVRARAGHRPGRARGAVGWERFARGWVRHRVLTS